jgi:diguanylate cyclase (GGDEF)-like protein/PAS domain S-box-containing protein
MNFSVFTQILQNIAATASVAFLYYLVINQRHRFTGLLIEGFQVLLFSVMTVFAFMTPISLSEGFQFDTRNVCIIMAFLYGGFAAGSGATVTAFFYRLALGGAGVLTGWVGIGLSLAAGIFFRLLMIKRKTRVLKLTELLPAGMAGALIGIISPLMTLPFPVFTSMVQAIWMPAILVLLTPLYIGTLFNFSLKRTAAERELHLSQEKIKSLFQSMNDAIFIIESRIIIECNPMTGVILSRTQGEIIGKGLSSLSPEKQPDGTFSSEKEEMILAAAEAGIPQFFHWKLCRPDGTFFDAEASLNRMADTDPVRIVVALRDITTRKESEDFMRVSSQIFDYSLEAIMITSPDGIIQFVNTAFTRITGYTKSDTAGKTPSILKSDYHEKDYYDRMWKKIVESHSWEGEIWNRRKNGEAFPAYLRITSVRDPDGDITHQVGIFNDLTELKRSQEEATYHMNYDALTRLPNRNAFINRLDQMLTLHRGRERSGCLLAIDIKSFRNINNHFGYILGDRLLQDFSERLTATFDEGTLISRVGKDEFVVYLPRIRGLEQVSQSVNKVLDSVKPPFYPMGQELRIDINIGAAFNSPGADADTLLKNADMALNQVKANQTDSYRIYREDMDVRIVQRINLETQFRKALDNNEIQVWYQPRIDIRSRTVAGMEALVRWIKPDGTFVPPLDFVSLAEETGLIGILGEQVLVKACDFTKRLAQDKGLDLRVSVNVSPYQIKTPGFVGGVKTSLLQSRLYASNLELEITESVFLEDTERALKILSELKEAGIFLALDDFGTGYSSLSYLKQLPLDTVKIDRSFIMDIDKDAVARNLAGNIIRMARDLGYETVAEGVEVREQATLLMNMNCSQIQGFYFSKALPEEQFKTFVDGFSMDKRMEEG